MISVAETPATASTASKAITTRGVRDVMMLLSLAHFEEVPLVLFNLNNFNYTLNSVIDTHKLPKRTFGTIANVKSEPRFERKRAFSSAPNRGRLAVVIFPSSTQIRSSVRVIERGIKVADAIILRIVLGRPENAHRSENGNQVSPANTGLFLGWLH
jgi:hypothetical protein